MYAMMLTTLAASCAAVVGSSKSSNALVMFGINWLQYNINKLFPFPLTPYHPFYISHSSSASHTNTIPPLFSLPYLRGIRRVPRIRACDTARKNLISDRVGEGGRRERRI